MTSARFAAIAHDLRERIALGEFGDLGAMDSESELCARYAVSRPTARRALEQLRSEGLVDSRHGAGWFVTAAAFHQRLAIGTFRHAASAVTQAGKAVERRVVEFGFRSAPAALAVTLGLEKRTPRAACPLRAHGRGRGPRRRHEWVPAAFGSSVSRDDATHPGIWETLGRQGHRVATVRQTITAGLASKSDAGLLGTATGAPLLLVRRLASRADGIPLALSDHRYAAHRFALEVEFNSGPAAATPEPPGLRAVDHPNQEHAS